MDALSGCARETEWLIARFHAIEGRFFVGAALEAKVAVENCVPGLTLAGSGVGAALGGEIAVALRYEVPRNQQPGSLSIELTKQSELELQLSFGVGVEGKAQVTRKIDVRFLHVGTRWTQVASEAGVELELGANGIAGIGLSGKAGAGVTLSMDFDNVHNGGKLIESVGCLLQGDAEAALERVGQLETTLAVQPWLEAAILAGGGYSAAGNGLQIIGTTTWHEAGVKLETPLTVQQAWDAIRTQAQSIATQLSSRVIPQR